MLASLANLPPEQQEQILFAMGQTLQSQTEGLVRPDRPRQCDASGT
jgi:hypothetical protein